MAGENFDTYVFENGQFAPFAEAVRDQLEWSDYMAQQGYADQEQVWGQYPDVYVKVYEAKPGAAAAFQYAAVVNLVRFPHHVFIRDINGLIQLLHQLLPLFALHSRPDQDTGDALFGSQGADEGDA